MVDHPRREQVWRLPISSENPMHKNSSRTLLIRGAMALAATVAAVPSAQAIMLVRPILPIDVVNGSFLFSFVARPGMNFIDPLVAVGYDYALNDGTSPAFQSVELPSVGDDLFTLSLLIGSQWTATATLRSGPANAYDFGSTGVREFRITGIEVSAALDPNDPTVFVTGLTFVGGTGLVNMSQTPITAAVPEPATYALLIFALAALGLSTRRRS